MDVATDDIELIRSADTLFLGTTHLERGNDASHRGGPADFVYADHETVEWPDYPGNNMFNSFGNLAVDPTNFTPRARTAPARANATVWSEIVARLDQVF